MGDPDYRYAAFISYRHVEPDRKWAKWLHGALESFRTPSPIVARGARPRIGRVFRDEEELPASADLTDEIDRALEQSEFLIVVCSPHTPESRWVNQEIVRFREMGRGDRILALLVAGEPSTSFPSAMVSMDPTSPGPAVEPLAADVRASRDESKGTLQRTALLRFAACLLGCRFDDLRQREAERRRRRLMALAGGLVVLVGVLAGALVYALNQRDAAIHERTIAQQQRERADEQRDVADRERTTAQEQRHLANEQRDVADRERQRAFDSLESAQEVSRFLTEDLLGSVDPRKARGREITVREILDNAGKGVGERFADRPAIEAAVRHMLGRVYLGIGRYEDSRAHLDRALALYQEVEGPRTLAVANVFETLAATMTAGTAQDHQKGVDYARQCADIREALLGKDHELTARARMDQEMYLQFIRGLPPGVASEPVLRVFAMLRGRNETVEEMRVEVMRLVSLATQLWQAGKKDELVKIAQKEAQMYLDNPAFAERVPSTWASFAVSLQRAGRPVAARALVFCAVEVAVANFTEGHPGAQYAIAATANILGMQEKLAEAATWQARYLRILRKTVGEDHRQALAAQEQFVILLVRLERYDEAEKEGLDLFERVKRTATNPQHARIVAGFLSGLYERMNKPTEAKRWKDRAK